MQELQGLQLQQEEESWAMKLVRKALGAFIGEACIGSLSAIYLVFKEVLDCWAVFLVTIVLAGFLLMPAG